MPVTELRHDSPFHLLIAVILSAQCTDKRVNMVVPPLFERFPEPSDLAAAGIDLKVEAIEGSKLLDEYYRLAETEYDILFLATNFDVLYDPSLNFIETEDGHHVWKTSGFEDDELWQLAVDMRRTEPEDVLTYCKRWLEFQKRFMEQLPVLPMYSNVYFDFYPDRKSVV